jgi:hypothetical protein
MKLHVIADSEGHILATARLTGGGGGAPTSGGLVAGPGQTVYEVEVPESVGQLDATLLHWRYKLEVRPGVARLGELAQPVAKP